METLVIHPKDEAQHKVLKTILDGFQIPYDEEPVIDETAYLETSEANKKALNESIQQAKAGQVKEFSLDDIWQQD